MSRRRARPRPLSPRDGVDPVSVRLTVTEISDPGLTVSLNYNTANGPILIDDQRGVVLAGDWCAGDRIEGAWISGVAAARRLESLL